jgi:hypothetical protein
MNLNDVTIAFITCRGTKGCAHWTNDSMEYQTVSRNRPKLLIVSLDYPKEIASLEPMPNIWSGRDKITKDNWWSKPCSINTAICRCETPWILLVDDRSIFAPKFFHSVQAALDGNYAMFGRYEKRVGVEVKNGQMTKEGTVTGVDSRYEYCQKNGITGAYPCPGEWAYGCCVLAPAEWLLQVNGSPEMCCGMGFEDAILGLVMQNNNFPMMYDPNALLIEDRTPSELGTPMRRTAKERWPNDKEDKAHTLLKMVKTMKSFEQPFGSLRELRARIQAGQPFPAIDRTKRYFDWFDKMDISTL